jgi:oxalate decarboxylase
MSTENQDKPSDRGFSRRTMFGIGSTLATAALAGVAANAQTRANTRGAEHDPSDSDPGPENAALLKENPNSNTPPPTDSGDVGPIWFSFDLTHKRIQEGGWTHQVTQREFPSSKDIAGVNMRVTAGSFRELHWHTADEWAIMLDGNCRVTVLDPEGKIYIDDVGKGDLWYFPAGHPHSIQGLGPNGGEFLLVFNQGMFSEDNTFLPSEWLAHTPAEVVTKNFGWDKATIAKLPKSALYIFPADLPKSLAEDRAAVGGPSVEPSKKFTFKMASMTPQYSNQGGEARIVDSRNFPAAQNIAAALLTIKPGGMRELHWHPHASEWQYYISGKGRFTVFSPVGQARTVDVNPNDVGFVPANAGHYIENTGDTDLVALEMFAAHEFLDVSFRDWLSHLPPEMITSHFGLDAATIKAIPSEKLEFAWG